MKSLLTSLLRHLKQRKLNRTHELIAELSALIEHWNGYHMGEYNNSPWQYNNSPRQPRYLVDSLGEWRGKRAALIVRANRLEKELSQS